ncbi:type III-B CRISPR module RAMP protein Cmr4 [Insolitispirillum peregrinum]|uniref:type III-B CRISPR module RAMP protein Cmr4 n=1 Tax=Insolitispirillum peregrinum TaxID=80876 RepID=UPI003615256F
MQRQPFIIHALSPLHAGTGQASDLIDLPIARMQSTGIPFVPGSSIKGVLRDSQRNANGTLAEEALGIFGPETDSAGDHAGALTCGDARLLALPVRSFKGAFAWVTSPLLLTLAARDMDISPPALVDFHGRGARVTEGSANVHRHQGKDYLYLEDYDLPAHKKPFPAELEPVFRQVFAGDDQWAMFRSRCAILDDETMAYLWEMATQIDTRVRINPETRTVAAGALWTEESLPPETLLIGVMSADRVRRPGCQMTPEDVLNRVLSQERVLQIGGKAAVGRGLSRLVPIRKGDGK